MKKSLFFNLILGLTFCTASIHAFAQSCCNANSTVQFAMLANDQKFLNSHADPLPFNFSAEKGKMIKLNSTDGKEANAFLVNADQLTYNFVFIFHEWWGLNDYIKQEAEKIQKELGNVNVMAIDLYDGKVADNKDSAGKYMKEVDQKRAETIINAAISYTGSRGKIYTLGWCFGGGWSLQASILAGKQGAGCVMYYGMPEKDLTKLKNLNADVLGIFATKDQWINDKVVTQFEKDMKTSGKNLSVKSFNADHAFANPSNPKYDKEASAQAHILAMDFLKKKLK